MSTAFQVAKHIRTRLPVTNAFKLQKLLYYAQAWSLVWQSRAMFDEPIEAWTHGPVVATVWADFTHNAGKQLANAGELAPDDLANVDRMLTMYGHYSSDELIALTHAEQPWRAVRAGMPSTAKSSAVISLQTMQQFYSALWKDAAETNAALDEPPAFTGSVDQLAALLA